MTSLNPLEPWGTSHFSHSAALLNLDLSAIDAHVPSECDDVIKSTHVSREAGSRLPPRETNNGGGGVPNSVLEQILGKQTETLIYVPSA